MSRRIGGAGMLALTVACMLVGCGTDKTPDVSSLSINKDGKVYNFRRPPQQRAKQKS